MQFYNYKRIYIFSQRQFYIFLQYQSISQTKTNLKKKTTTMNNILSSENQSSSQFYKPEEQPDLNLLQVQINNELDPEVASRIAKNISIIMKVQKNKKFQRCLNIVSKLIEKGYSKEISKFSVIMQVLMEKFSYMTSQIQNNSNSQLKIMRLLSIIAELIKEAPQIQIFMKKRFLQSILLIDQELVQASPIKKDILAVLGVLYQFISKQSSALRKFQLTKRFKKAILSNYSLLQQYFSCRLFNKALYNLAIQGQAITQADLSKYGIITTLSKILGSQQAIAIIQKIKMALEKLSSSKKIEVPKKITQMVAES